MPKGKKKSAVQEGDPYDETRLKKGLEGWWLSLEQAETQCAYCCGDEEVPWFARTTREGLRVQPVQYVKNAPADKPVWLFANGDMYLGPWKEKGPDGHPVEHGFGITYNEYPNKVKGLIYIGVWKDGHGDGKGESFWLESSRTWKQNYFPGSAIKQRGSGGIPFHYCGRFKNDYKCDKEAIVRTKDGTTRKGPWKDGHPVGGWDSHTSVAWGGGGTASSSCSSDEEEEQAKPLPATKRQRTSRQQRQDQREQSQNPNLVSPSVAIKQEPMDEEDAAGVSLSVDAAADKERRLHQIRTWISEKVITEDLSPATTKLYASKLFEEGFESVRMVKKYLKQKHVESYQWMSFIHKEIFLDGIKEKWEEF